MEEADTKEREMDGKKRRIDECGEDEFTEKKRENRMKKKKTASRNRANVKCSYLSAVNAKELWLLMHPYCVYSVCTSYSYDVPNIQKRHKLYIPVFLRRVPFKCALATNSLCSALRCVLTRVSVCVCVCESLTAVLH